ncbi:hypothetical protein TNCV_4639051 [Trichonephila clavipes]|nr:hypothetical protein TNCV_4639051 [Trichonephila clavipes]
MREYLDPWTSTPVCASDTQGLQHLEKIKSSPYPGTSVSNRVLKMTIEGGKKNVESGSRRFLRDGKTKIVRVQYFVRGGFVGHRSRASSKHLSPHLPVDELDSSGVKKGLRCKMHVRVSGPQRSRLDVDVSEK